MSLTEHAKEGGGEGAPESAYTECAYNERLGRACMEVDVQESMSLVALDGIGLAAFGSAVTHEGGQEERRRKEGGEGEERGLRKEGGTMAVKANTAAAAAAQSLPSIAAAAGAGAPDPVQVYKALSRLAELDSKRENFALWAAEKSIRNLTLHLIGKRWAAAAVHAEEAHGEQQGGTAGWAAAAAVHGEEARGQQQGGTAGRAAAAAVHGEEARRQQQGGTAARAAAAAVHGEEAHGEQQGGTAGRAEEAHGEQQGGPAGRGARDLLALMLAAHEEASNEQMTDQQLMDECITFLLADINHLLCIASLLCIVSPPLPVSPMPIFLLPPPPSSPPIFLPCRLLSSSVPLSPSSPTGRPQHHGAPADVDVLSSGEASRLARAAASRAQAGADSAGGTGHVSSPHSQHRRRSSRQGRAVRLGPYDVPRGVNVLIPVALLHYDPRYWGPQALHFNPDRFSRTDEACSHPQAFLPFGSGPRICIGNNFALTETKVVLAHILRQFSWRLSPAYKHSPVSAVALRASFGMHLMVEPLANPF
ncbi:unnamed protein product [Closterium sp. Naga37s-1]|nr:unnamed protein product [Closterium sp. Naga37s-1]